MYGHAFLRLSSLKNRDACFDKRAILKTISATDAHGSTAQLFLTAAEASPSDIRASLKRPLFT
jgi:hypothetical protein